MVEKNISRKYGELDKRAKLLYTRISMKTEARYWIDVTDNDWMGLKELAEFLDIPYGTLRNAVTQRRIKARKSGGVWLCKPQAVFEALEAKRIRNWRE